MSKIIGHRGSCGEFPENTLLGIKEAIKNGVDGVEIDVRLTKDNQLVVIHDETVDRTTNGEGKVENLALKEIKELDAGDGEKIPTLQEVMDLIRETGLLLAIEIKCQKAENIVIDCILNNNLQGNTLVKSFDHRIVQKVKKIDKRVKTSCLLVGLPIHPYKLLDDAKADALSINSNYIDKELIDECHKHGRLVFVWNVDDKESVKKFIKMGADYICTNFPSKMKLQYFGNPTSGTHLHYAVFPHGLSVRPVFQERDER